MIGITTLFPFIILLIEINGYPLLMNLGDKIESMFGLCCDDVNISGNLALVTGFIMSATWIFYMFDACINPTIGKVRKNCLDNRIIGGKYNC